MPMPATHFRYSWPRKFLAVIAKEYTPLRPHIFDRKMPPGSMARDCATMLYFLPAYMMGDDGEGSPRRKQKARRAEARHQSGDDGGRGAL